MPRTKMAEGGGGVVMFNQGDDWFETRQLKTVKLNDIDEEIDDGYITDDWSR